MAIIDELAWVSPFHEYSHTQTITKTENMGGKMSKGLYWGRRRIILFKLVLNENQRVLLPKCERFKLKLVT